MISRPTFRLRRQRLALAQGGTPVLAVWKTFTGTPDPVTDAYATPPTEQVAWHRALVHFPDVSKMVVKQFNEIEAGDCILDLDPDGASALDGVKQLVFLFGTPLARVASAGATTWYHTLDPHGLATGDKVTVRGAGTAATNAFALDASQVAVTLDGAKKFTFAGGYNATTGGAIDQKALRGAAVFNRTRPDAWTQKQVSEQLSRSWDLILGGRRILRTILLSKAR